MRAPVLLLCLASLLPACGGGGSGGEGGEEADNTAEDLPNGAFLLTFSIAAVGGLAIPFQAEVRGVEDAEGNRFFESFALRNTDGADAVSDVITAAYDVPIDEAGAFSVDLGTFTIAAEYSPTSSAIDVQAVLTGQVQSADAFCGDVAGLAVTVGIDLAGSTFGAVPWEQRSVGEASVACEAVSDEPIPRMDAADCPALQAGTNSGFSSGGEARSFEVVVPSTYDGSTPTPLVFAFHGIDGEPGDMLDDPGELREWADGAGVILVAPAALESGGRLLWDFLTGESSNLDLVLFDDLVTCASESWNVDPDRIYATGMSNGGLFTGLLIAMRSTVLAAAAPISGGIASEWSEEVDAIPVQVTWGGEKDSSNGQDFNTLALEMIEALLDQGSFVVQCDHGTGHELYPEFWPWTFDFFQAHPKGVDPEPFAGGLPDSYADYCTIAN